MCVWSHAAKLKLAQTLALSVVALGCGKQDSLPNKVPSNSAAEQPTNSIVFRSIGTKTASGRQQSSFIRHKKEIVLASAPASLLPQDRTFELSPDGRRVAFVCRAAVNLSSESQMEAERFLQGTASNMSGKLFNELRKHEGRSFVSVDGLMYPPAREVMQGGFSPDSKRYAYLALSMIRSPSGARYDQHYYGQLVIDGIPLGRVYPQGQETRFLGFSADGTKCAFQTLRSANSKHRVIVVDGKDLSAIGDHSELVFSPVGNDFAYVTIRSLPRSETFVVHAGREFGPYAKVAVLQFSADGKHWGFRAVKRDDRGQENEHLIVVDGKEEAMGNNGLEGLILGKFAATPLVIHRNRIMWNGREFFSRGYIHSVQLAPDEQRLAWMEAVRAPGQKPGSQVVEGDDLHPTYSRILSLQFSPDSKHLGYIAQTDDRVVLVVDKNESVLSGAEFASGLTFSPRGHRVAAYAYEQEPPNRVVAVWTDGRKVGEYAEVLTFEFSPDDRRLAFVAKRPDGRWGVVVDGDFEVVPDKPLSWKFKQLWWDAADRLRYACRSGERVILIEETISSSQ
jgi:hypothetical protein